MDAAHGERLVNRVEALIGGADVTSEDSWRILRLLRELGADEFAIEMMHVGGGSTDTLDALEKELAPFGRGEPDREYLIKPEGLEWVRPRRVWALNDHTEGILRRVFPEGLLAFPTHETDGGWLEDPTIYQDGSLVFGAVSHEGEALVRLPSDSFRALSGEIGATLHSRGEWM